MSDTAYSQNDEQQGAAADATSEMVEANRKARDRKSVV